MKNFLLIILAFLTLSTTSCQSYMADFLPERPTHKMDDSIKNTSAEFQQGWRDGCEVGMATGSNTFYKMFYRMNRVDGYKMAYSAEYKTGWSNSFWYCYRHDWVKQKSSIWGSMFSGVQ